MSSEVNWDRLSRQAREHHRRQAVARRRAGQAATEDAERLAHTLQRTGIPARDAGAVLVDQTVYVFRGEIMLAHLPASTMWEAVETPAGMALRTLLLAASGDRWAAGPQWDPGEWTYCGRGLPGVEG